MVVDISKARGEYAAAQQNKEKPSIVHNPNSEFTADEEEELYRLRPEVRPLIEKTLLLSKVPDDKLFNNVKVPANAVDAVKGLQDYITPFYQYESEDPYREDYVDVAKRFAITIVTNRYDTYMRQVLGKNYNDYAALIRQMKTRPQEEIKPTPSRNALGLHAMHPALGAFFNESVKVAMQGNDLFGDRDYAKRKCDSMTGSISGLSPRVYGSDSAQRARSSFAVDASKNFINNLYDVPRKTPRAVQKAA